MQKQNKDLHLRTFFTKKEKKCSIWKWRGGKKRHAETQMPKSNTLNIVL